ncbi:cation-translocating P-type ATPase, partial [Streptomyces sp. SID1328]|nr:cation-translocating P-type ATPase [Streptomyces sp. SID1328]
AHWRSGARVHLPLRAAEPDRVRAGGGHAHLARRIAAGLADRPDVLLAYWDEGLARLVVTLAEDAVSDRVVDRAAELAERDGLLVAGGDPEEYDHPADPAGVRAAATTLATDLAGIAAALTGYALRLPATPRAVTACVTLLRENPRVRALLRSRIGAARMDLLLAGANALAHAAGQTPTSLVLDGALRSLQLAETVARSAAFDSLHDELCGPERLSVAPTGSPRPPLRESPAQVYAAHASAGSVLGALAALLVKHDLNSVAEAALSGSPKAARYAPAAFHAVLGTALARADVLVRDPERLRQLEMAGTLLLHPSALRTGEGLPDPWTEAVLDAARRARLRVVLVDDPALEDFSGLADQVVDARRPLDDVVHALRGELDAGDEEGGEERVVITVARPRALAETGVLAGLDAADIAVALTDQEGAVVWGADILAPHGLPDVWRLLTAIPAARAVGSRGQLLARSGAA